MMLTSQKARKYATFRYLFLFPRHQDYGLDVCGVGEHIYGLDFVEFVGAVLG